MKEKDNLNLTYEELRAKYEVGSFPPSLSHSLTPSLPPSLLFSLFLSASNG
jgi:hypothetical protein